MNQNDKSLRDYLNLFERSKGRFSLVVTVLALVSVVVSFVLPPVYQSTATILIEQQEIPEDLVRSTITSFADQRIQVISQRVMTRSNLTQIIKKFDLYAEERAREPMEVIVDDMRDDIKMDTVSADVVDPRSGRPTSATIAFTLAFDYRDAKLSQKVANELVSLFLNENLKSRTQLATETSVFLAEETKKLSQQIESLEQEMAQFKERNQGQLPELAQLNMNLMDRAEQQILEIDGRIRELGEKRIYLQSQLVQIDPYLGFASGGDKVLGMSERLKLQESEYLRVSSLYGENHPDVKRAKKELETLRAQTGARDENLEFQQQYDSLQSELVLAQKKYSADHPDVKRLTRELAALRQKMAADVGGGKGGDNVLKTAMGIDKPDNPAFIQLRAQLEAAEQEINSLLFKKNELQGKQEMYEKRITQTPEVERRYKELTRDYENAWAKYRELKAKQMEAQLAESLESERKGERFTLIEPPEMPEKPLKPNRMAILFIGFLFSTVGGAGTVILGDNMDPTVRGGRTFINSSPLTFLGNIPAIVTPQDRKRRLRRNLLLIMGALLILVLLALGINFFTIPLDVLWYKAQQRMGF